MAGFYENLPFFAVKIFESVAGGIAIVLPRGVMSCLCEAAYYKITAL